MSVCCCGTRKGLGCFGLLDYLSGFLLSTYRDRDHRRLSQDGSKEVQASRNLLEPAVVIAFVVLGVTATVDVVGDVWDVLFGEDEQVEALEDPHVHVRLLEVPL